MTAAKEEQLCPHCGSMSREGRCCEWCGEELGNSDVLDRMGGRAANAEARIAALEAERDGALRCATAFDEEFCCPECCSLDVHEITHPNDFGSMACRDCGYGGEPGEDFPTARKIRSRLTALEAELAEARDKLAEMGGSMMANEQKIDDQRELIFELREGIGDVDLWESLVAQRNALRSALAAAEEREARMRERLATAAESLVGVSEGSEGFCWCARCIPASRDDACRALEGLVHSMRAALAAPPQPQGEES